MHENKFDEALEEVSVCYGLNWNDDSKIRLLVRFLEEQGDPLLFQQFEKFLEVAAEEEMLDEDEADEFDDDDDEEGHP
jgi:hypothetical protein